MEDKHEEVLLSEFSDEVSPPQYEEKPFKVTMRQLTSQNSYYVADGSINSASQAKKKVVASRFRTKVKCYKCCEVMILGVIVLVIATLFSIPTIYFAIPSTREVVAPNRTNVSDASVCLQGTTTLYSGELCKAELTSLQTCFSGSPSPLTLPSNVDQQQGENNMMRLVLGLEFLDPSPMCEESVLPFLCLYTFGLCDCDGDYHTTLRDMCTELRDDICVREWSVAMNFLTAGSLPVCDNLPDISEECIAVNTTAVIENDTTTVATPLDHSPTTQLSNALNSSLNCSEGFFYDQNDTGLCRPICGEFNRIKGYDIVLQRVCICVGLATTILMFILAFTIQRTTLLVFPSILLVYLCMSTIFIYVVIIVGFFDNTGLYCGSQDLLYAIGKGNSTALCTISGIAFTYTIVQVCVWITLHAIFLFWGVAFPFHYRHLRITKRLKYAHITSVLLGLVIPLPAALVPLKDGYIVTTYPAFACAARNTEVTFYTLILPLSVLLALTTILLALMFWIILKDFVLKKLKAGQKVGKVGKAQIKISFIFIYYILVGVMGLVSLTYFEVKGSIIGLAALADFLVCESFGNSNCQLDEELIFIFESLSVAVKIMLFLLPVVVVIFSVDVQALKKLFKKSAGPSHSTISTSVKTKTSVLSR